uniref:tRNA-5-taurinomethyluridine 2-sulfurtransferase n=1 Tax=Heterorhabditis bacteriophora TaxID=37862 RepID=A0A1I7WIX0_HETBA
MIENYRMGRTVVPDIQCNRSIKFEHLHNYAINKLGVDYIATGHYASTSQGDFQERCETDKKNSELFHHQSLFTLFSYYLLLVCFSGVQLFTAVDPIKDQTYFLSTLKQNQLRRALFPLGSITKPQVKLIAVQQGLEKIAKKAESMGVCFIGKRRNFEEFMDQPLPGAVILLRDGSVLGEHSGVHRFTLGKRLALHSLRTGSHLGYFVAKIDSRRNIIYVCEGSNDPCLYATEFLIREPEWIDKKPVQESRISNLECRIQRTHPPIPSHVRRESQDTLRVIPSLPLRAVAEGQIYISKVSAKLLVSYYLRDVSLGLDRQKCNYSIIIYLFLNSSMSDAFYCHSRP